MVFVSDCRWVLYECLSFSSMKTDTVLYRRYAIGIQCFSTEDSRKWISSSFLNGIDSFWFGIIFFLLLVNIVFKILPKTILTRQNIWNFSLYSKYSTPLIAFAGHKLCIDEFKMCYAHSTDFIYLQLVLNSTGIAIWC